MNLTCLDCSRHSRPQWQKLQSMLRENAHPSSVNGSKVFQLLADAETELRMYDEEIKKQYAFIITLKNHRKAAERNVEGYKSLMSPIRKLPPETLRTIFLYACTTQIMVDHQSPMIPALPIGQVCAHWRGIVLSTKEVWSKIYLGIGKELIKSPVRYQKARDALEELLARSGNAPLKLTVNISCLGERIDELVGLLVQNCRRWQWFHLCTQNPASKLPPSFQSIENHLPALERLHLNLFGMDVYPVTLFRDAPKLSTVEIVGQLSQNLVPLPRDQISFFAAESFSAAGVTNALNEMPQLDSLMLVKCRNPSQVDPPATSQLRSLTVFLSNDNTDVSVLQNFVLPSLNELRVVIEDDKKPMETDFPLPILSSLFSRSGCTLTELCWCGVPVKPRAWMSFLASVPSVVDLTLSDCSPNVTLAPDIFFERLQDHLSGCSNTPFLPKLKHLALSMQRKSFACEMFFDAVESRWLPQSCTEHNDESSENVVCLLSASLWLPNRHLGELRVKRMENLIAAGMKIAIKDFNGIVLC